MRRCVISILGFVFMLSCVARGSAQAATLTVPGQHSTIQSAIDAALDGDTVLVAPGIWSENLSIDNKAVTLASLFHTTGDSSHIGNTIIDGGGGGFVIEIGAAAGPTTSIIGFTVRNGDDGIRPFAKFNLLDSRITGTSDGIDYEDGSGGLVQRSTFEDNSDDGIDLDRAVEVTIEDSIIRNNGNDGIEIRLHPYVGTTLQVVIRNNLIAENGLGGTPNGDGIQFIEYTPGSAREFRIERNIFRGNAQAAIGMMCCQDTAEDLSGASLLEKIFVFNNTFTGNDHGITGGDNTVVVNNIFLDTANIALKRVDGNSIAAYNLFFNNGTDASESNVDVASSVYADPELAINARPGPTSPALDAGTATYTWNSEQVLDLPASAYAGSAPDIGAVERGNGFPVPGIGSPGAGLIALGVVLAMRLRVGRSETERRFHRSDGDLDAELESSRTPHFSIRWHRGAAGCLPVSRSSPEGREARREVPRRSP